MTNEALDEFLRALPEHVIAVLDEAYYEFLDDAPDTVARVRAGERVVLMRTFSKIQGLAGLRIGYGLAPAEIADLLQRARQPFNANSIAQAGAMAGLLDREHQEETKAITDAGRALFERTFAEMGLAYVPSAANFVLVHVGNGGEVFQRLMKKGIIVRSMVSYRLPAYIRVSVGTPEQNARFLAELPGAIEGLVPFTNPAPPAIPGPARVAPQEAEGQPGDALPTAGSFTITRAITAHAPSNALAETQPLQPITPPDPGPTTEPGPEPTPDPHPAPEPHEPEPAAEPQPQPSPEPATLSS